MSAVFRSQYAPGAVFGAQEASGSPANASGDLAPISLSAATGTAQGLTAGFASGSFAALSLSAATGTAESVDPRGFASGSFAPVSLTAPQTAQSVGGLGFEFTSTPSALWWKRKPKALPEKVAEQQVQRVVRVIKEVAAKQQPEQTAKQAQREVAQAVAPLLADMPGFDWTPLYRNIVQKNRAREQMQAAIDRARFIEQDDEDVLLLLI